MIWKVENNELIKHEGGLIKRVGNDIKITNKLLKINSKKVHIVHFDDHRIFLNGVQTAILKKTSAFYINGFTEGDEALKYIEDSFIKKRKVDLIITGMNQPKYDGFTFSKSVRDIEKKHDLSTPIILLSMMAGNPERNQQYLAKGFEAGLWNMALGKNANSEELYEAIMSLVDKNIV
jgi:PleD family two-component response regulator